MLQEYIKEVGNNLEEIIDPCHKNGSCLYSLPSICTSQELAIKSFITSALITLHDRIIRGEIERLEGTKRYIHLPEGYVNDNPNFDKMLNSEDTKCMIINEFIDDQIIHLKSLLTNK